MVLAEFLINELDLWVNLRRLGGQQITQSQYDFAYLTLQQNYQLR